MQGVRSDPERSAALPGLPGTAGTVRGMTHDPVSVKVRRRAMNVILALLLGVFGLVFLSMGFVHSLGSGPRAKATPVAARVILFAATIGSANLVVRAARLGLDVTGDGIVIRNLGQTYRVAWPTVTNVDVVNSGNVTGAAWCVAIRAAGRTIKAKGTASDSKERVEEFGRAILAQAPGRLHE